MGNRAFIPSPAYLILPSFIDLIKIILLLMVWFFVMEKKFWLQTLKKITCVSVSADADSRNTQKTFNLKVPDSLYLLRGCCVNAISA